jgi:glutathione S-transferase
MFPQFEVDDNYPNLVRWRECVTDRPAVQDALASEDRTQPGLRTWGGDGREHS